MTRAVDPGWGEAIRKVPSMMLPTRGMRLALASPNGLTVMRVVWLTFVGVMVGLGAVVVAIDLAFPGGGADGRAVGVVVAALGAVLQLLSPRFVPEIAGTRMEPVRATAQRAFFVRVAFAEPAALIGFMGFVLSGNVAVYVIGAAMGLAGMYDAAPTSRWIAQSQQTLQANGSDVDFLAAITSGGITR